MFGTGRAIVVTGTGGGVGRIMLFPHLPFALPRLTLKNSGTAAETLNHVPVASWSVDLGQPASTLKTLGTGGLSEHAKPPGAVVDGDSDTHWSSITRADPQWISVDLGKTEDIRRVRLDWETAYAKSYEVSSVK